MVIAIDFDYTLFNTHLFFNAYKDTFLKHGVKETDWRRTYDRAMLWGEGNYGFDYSFEKNVDLLIEEGYVLDRDQFVKDLYDCISDKFLYHDTISFLTDIKKHFPERVLITAGDADFQSTKVETVGVDTYFTDLVYINGDKDQYLKKAYTDTDCIVFINDNLIENAAVKKAIPHAHVITKFNPHRNTIEEVRESGLPYFETLTAIKEYVTNELI